MSADSLRRAGVPRADEASFRSLCALVGLFGLGDAAEPVPPIRRRATAPGPTAPARAAHVRRFVPAGRCRKQPVNRHTISRLFYHALALSAWKQAPGTPPWSLRINPSSGDVAPDRRLSCRRADQRPQFHRGRLSLLAVPARPGAAVGLATGRSGVAGREAARRCRADRPDVDLLAGIVEVRRAGVPLLQPRCGTCDRSRGVFRRDAGFEPV